MSDKSGMSPCADRRSEGPMIVRTGQIELLQRAAVFKTPSSAVIAADDRLSRVSYEHQKRDGGTNRCADSKAAWQW
jgi:hypothetical protein